MYSCFGWPFFYSLLFQVLHLQGKKKEAEDLIRESIRILEVALSSTYSWYNFQHAHYSFDCRTLATFQEAGLGESATCIRRMRYLTQVVNNCTFVLSPIFHNINFFVLSKAIQIGCCTTKTCYELTLNEQPPVHVRLNWIGGALVLLEFYGSCNIIVWFCLDWTWTVCLLPGMRLNCHDTSFL